MSGETVSVRYMVDDVEDAIDFYTDKFGFTLGHNAAPAFAEVLRGNLRLLLAGPTNRIHFIVDDIATEVDRLRAAGVGFRNEIISGPGGQQILADDPSGNPIELFQPAA